MFNWKRLMVMLMGLALVIMLSACGTVDNSNATSATNVGSAATPTSTPTQATAASPVVKVATATVKGAAKTILTDAKGMTLYYFTPDTSDKVACVGDCASTWPPVLNPNDSTPVGDAAIQPGLKVSTTPNGKQVLYNGHFLYTFSGDTAVGQANGEGVGNKWFVATPDLKQI